MLEIRLLRDAASKAVLLKGPSLQDHIDFFSREAVPHRTYLAALSEGKVVGLAALLEQSGRVENAFGLCFISTHDSHRNQGVATALSRALFELASKERRGISSSYYEELGERYLKPVLHRTAQAFSQVTFVEQAA